MALMLLLYGLVPVAQITAFLMERSALSAGNIVNYAASLLLLHWLLANMLVAAKIPFFQKAIPYDRRVKLHIYTSLGIYAALAYHVGYKLAMGKWIDPVSWALLGLLLLLLAGAIAWIPLPLCRKARSLFLTLVNPGYDFSKKWHRTLLLGIVLLLFVHIAQADFFNQIPLPSLGLFLALYLLALGSHLSSYLGLFRKKTKVSDVRVSGNIVEITLESKRPVSYHSGQFAFLRLKGPKGYEEHPFSFLSSPQENQVRFAVRMLGNFTRHLSFLSPGTTVTIKGGFGSFYPRENKPYCFISSGIGVVPFISILKDMQARGDQRPVLFFISVNSREEIPEVAALYALAEKMPGLRLKVLEASSGKRYSADYFREEILNPGDYSYLLCSSPKVRAAILEALQGLDVPSRSIGYEDFAFGR